MRPPGGRGRARRRPRAVGVAWAAGSRGRAESGQPRPSTASRRADRLGGPRLWASSRGVGASAAAPGPEVPVGGEGCRRLPVTAAAGCECGSSPRGRAPEGPAWRPLAPSCTRPGGLPRPRLARRVAEEQRRPLPASGRSCVARSVSPVPEAGDGSKM